MNTKDTIVSILYRYYKQEILTAEETSTLQTWLSESDSNQMLFDELSNEQEWEQELAKLKMRDGDPSWQRIHERIKKGTLPRRIRLDSLRWAAAVIGFMVLAGSAWYIWRTASSASRTVSVEDSVLADIYPGHPDSLITLLLADGTTKTIKHDDTAAVVVNAQHIAEIKDDQLVYSNQTENSGMHTLRVPVGQQFHLVLPDGSKVFMNAASSLRYPATFNAEDRTVWLEGEASFDVVTNTKQLFVVRTNRGKIKVTGTKFVVSDYRSDPYMFTGLLEGRIHLESGGNGQEIHVGEVWLVGNKTNITRDTQSLQQLTAWQKRTIWFKDATYEEIFRTLRRWYNIDFAFRSTPTTRFSGILPTDRSLHDLLAILEKQGKIRFTVQGQKVMINP